MQAQVLPGVADHPDPVNGWVEIKAKLSATQCRGKASPYCRCSTIGRIDGINAARAAQGIQLTSRRAHVNAQNRFTTLQTSDRLDDAASRSLWVKDEQIGSARYRIGHQCSWNGKIDDVLFGFSDIHGQACFQVNAIKTRRIIPRAVGRKYRHGYIIFRRNIKTSFAHQINA